MRSSIGYRLPAPPSDSASGLRLPLCLPAPLRFQPPIRIEDRVLRICLRFNLQLAPAAVPQAPPSNRLPTFAFDCVLRRCRRSIPNLRRSSISSGASDSNLQRPSDIASPVFAFLPSSDLHRRSTLQRSRRSTSGSHRPPILSSTVRSTLCLPLDSFPPAVPSINCQLASAINLSAVPAARFPASVSAAASGSTLWLQPPVCTGCCFLQLAFELTSDFRLRLRPPAVPSIDSQLASVFNQQRCQRLQPPTSVGYCISGFCLPANLRFASAINRPALPAINFQISSAANS